MYSVFSILTNAPIARPPLLGFSDLAILIDFEHEIKIIPKYTNKAIKSKLHF